MSQRYRKASITLLFTGAALSLLSGFLLVSASIARETVAPHPMHESAPWGKPKVTRDDPAHVLMLLEAIDHADADVVAKATMLVASGMANYWPALGVHDAALDCGFLEDPIEWTWRFFLGGAEELVPGFTEHQTLERADWRIALRKGVGFCSQQSMVLAGYLRERGLNPMCSDSKVTSSPLPTRQRATSCSIQITELCCAAVSRKRSQILSSCVLRILLRGLAQSRQTWWSKSTARRGTAFTERCASNARSHAERYFSSSAS